MLVQTCTSRWYKVFDTRKNLPPRSLHITGPRQGPRVDKPHPASITSTRPAGCAWKEVVQVRRWCGTLPVPPTGTTGGVSQDILNGDDVKKAFCGLARIQSDIQLIITILLIKTFMLRVIIQIMHTLHQITIGRIIVRFQSRHEVAIERLESFVCCSRRCEQK
jgi:hypothetical protein